MWERQIGEGEGGSRLKEGMLLDHGRETIATNALNGEPLAILKMPGDSLAPLLLTLALSVLFVGMLYHWWWLAGAATLGSVAAGVFWLWPREKLLQTLEGGDE
jgi:cytochrome c oxidase subunit 1/cytochrome c oxidase subunit I+III